MSKQNDLIALAAALTLVGDADIMDTAAAAAQENIPNTKILSAMMNLIGTLAIINRVPPSKIISAVNWDEDWPQQELEELRERIRSEGESS